MEASVSRLESIEGVEKELSRLYEEKGEACRASLFNFLVWAPSLERAGYLHELVEPLTEKFPCRVIFITKTLGPKLEIEVSINVKPAVACDLIEIRAPEKEIHKLPYLILPQFLPDLPIYLLWGQDPTLKSHLYELLFPYATRILFDSACVNNLQNLKQNPHEKLRDLNWSLISGWRQVISRLLDTPDKLQAAKKGTHVTITYHEGSSIQAHFLKSWLIAKLKMAPERFILTPSALEGSNGDLLSLELATPLYHFSLLRRNHQLVAHISTEQACELPQNFPLTHVKRGFNFWRELLFEPRSQDYLEMLANL